MTDLRSQQITDGLRQDEADDYAYRFQYADKSAFQIYADGSAFIIFPDGRRERKEGVIINRIPMLIGFAAKPRQDRIRELETALRFYADGRRYQGANQNPIPDDPYAKPGAVYIQDVMRDLGSIARAALSKGAA